VLSFFNLLVCLLIIIIILQHVEVVEEEIKNTDVFQNNKLSAENLEVLNLKIELNRNTMLKLNDVIIYLNV
jgi:hypothetical protein